MIYPLVYGNIISIIKTRRSVLSNDHRRVSALQEPLPSEGPPNDRWYSVFDEEHKNSQWALLDPKGKIKPLASDERQPAPVNFGDQITLGASVPVNGVATMCYLSCRDDARAGAGRKVATALHPNPWELWTIIDPTNTTSTRQVHTDDVIVLQSAFGDYLSATTTSANKVLQTAPSSSEAERWIAGSPVLLERKLLHYQDGICIVKGDDDDDDRKHISAPGTKTGTVGLDTTALSDANRWIIWKDDDRGTEKAARFGDIVLLRTDKLTNSQERATFLFMTYRRGSSVEIGVNQYKKTETERWKIVDPYAPDSVGQVRYGDRFALKGLSGTGEYLVAKAGGAGTSPTRDGAAIWTLGDPVTEASADLGGAKIPQAANDSAIMLYASHNIAKTAISKGLGMIPTVGPMVAGLYGIMYPDGDDIWTLIQERVKLLINQAIDDNVINQFVINMQGLKSKWSEYLTLEDVVEKGKALDRVIGDLDGYGENALKLPLPQQSLPHLVVMATLHLTALHEKYANYHRYAPTATANDIQRSRMKLKRLIVTYSNAVNDFKTKAIAWRKDLITEWQTYQGGGIWVMQDDYVPSNSYFASRIWSNDLSLEGFRNRIGDIFATQLEAAMLPAFLWRYLDPDNDKMPRRVEARLTTGQYGKLGQAEGGRESPNGKTRGIQKGRRFWNEGSPLRTISGDGGDVNMLQINDTAPFGDQGRPKNNSIKIDVEGGERITKATGRQGWSCHQITFHTNRGRKLEIGSANGDQWSAELPPETDPILLSVAGSASDRLDNVYLNWAYMRWE